MRAFMFTKFGKNRMKKWAVELRDTEKLEMLYLKDSDIFFLVPLFHSMNIRNLFFLESSLQARCPSTPLDGNLKCLDSDPAFFVIE